MQTTPFVQRLERWVHYNADYGITLEYIAVHPDEYYRGRDNKQSPAEKVGFEYAGLQIVPLGYYL